MDLLLLPPPPLLLLRRTWLGYASEVVRVGCQIIVAISVELIINNKCDDAVGLERMKKKI